jgi:6-phosphogluconolactonase
MVRCFETPEDLVNSLCNDFRLYAAEILKTSEEVHIALSGGNTPRAFLATLASDHREKGKTLPWEKIHFYWSDERCVPSDHADSNYRMASDALFNKISINKKNVHRIRGENDPFYEAIRYAEEISSHVPLQDSLPLFDLIFLGVGEDGHCASIFPDRTDLINSGNVCEAVKHPATGNWRVTLTGPPLIRSKRLVFIVTSSSKSAVIRQILNKESSAANYPASLVNAMGRNIDWFIDREAAKFINTSCRD